MTPGQHHVVVERSWDPPLTDAAMQATIASTEQCLSIHRVDWQGSLLSIDGSELICHFIAPDAESVRVALRRAGANPGDSWAATVHDAPGVTGADLVRANVVVSRRFYEPAVFEEVQALEDAARGCLALHRVDFVRTLFSADRRRMICLYRAPDAESVRLAQREARMPVDRVWAFRRYAP